ncbi:MAG TPA: hypothetical protein PKW80_12390 [Bacteroidales bacterium]|nr:hypothetical protein [Bacteroidales bacterium]
MKVTLSLILIGLTLFEQEKIFVMPAYDTTKSVNLPTMQYVLDQFSISFANSKSYQSVDRPTIEAMIDSKAFYEQGYISDKAKIELGKIRDCNNYLLALISGNLKDMTIDVS